MNHYGIDVQYCHRPSLDPNFIPLGRFNQAYLEGATVPFALAVERADGQIATHSTYIYGTQLYFDADVFYIDRLVKSILWLKGGFKVYLSGDPTVCDAVAQRYSLEGSRRFDCDFMSTVYGQPFQVVTVDKIPSQNDSSQAVGRHFGGCRIGFDAGGSDRKVSAVIDGESVFSEEVVWHPKITADPDYHYQGILDAFRSAAAHMPSVDAIGISSAGIFIENETKVASLFLSVSREDFDAKVRDIYTRAAKEMGDVPVVVANDGDVTALAGAISLEENNVLGIAMGTSEAVGFVDAQGHITGWLNELAFMPVDANPDAMVDEWSGDIGVGCKYFSQDAVIKLAPAAGIQLDSALSPAEKLKVVQKRMEEDDSAAAAIYDSIGVYLAHSLVFYHQFYHFHHVLLLGRVMSGKGGDLILSRCNQVLADEYPTVAAQISPALPDEKFRRVGQSVAAASLPE